MYYILGGCFGLCVMFLGMLIVNRGYAATQREERQGPINWDDVTDITRKIPSVAELYHIIMNTPFNSEEHKQAWAMFGHPLGDCHMFESGCEVCNPFKDKKAAIKNVDAPKLPFKDKKAAIKNVDAPKLPFKDKKADNIPNSRRFEDCTLCLRNRGDAQCDRCQNKIDADQRRERFVLTMDLKKKPYCECEEKHCVICNTKWNESP